MRGRIDDHKLQSLTGHTIRKAGEDEIVEMDYTVKFIIADRRYKFEFFDLKQLQKNRYTDEQIVKKCLNEIIEFFDNRISTNVSSYSDKKYRKYRTTLSDIELYNIDLQEYFPFFEKNDKLGAFNNRVIREDMRLFLLFSCFFIGEYVKAKSLRNSDKQLTKEDTLATIPQSIEKKVFEEEFLTKIKNMYDRRFVKSLFELEEDQYVFNEDKNLKILNRFNRILDRYGFCVNSFNWLTGDIFQDIESFITRRKSFYINLMSRRDTKILLYYPGAKTNKNRIHANLLKIEVKCDKKTLRRKDITITNAMELLEACKKDRLSLVPSSP